MTMYRACTPIDAILWICRNRLKTHFTLSTHICSYSVSSCCLSLSATPAHLRMPSPSVRTLSLSLSCSPLSFFLLLSACLSRDTRTHTHRKSHYSDLGAGYTVLLHQQNRLFVNIQPANDQFSVQRNGEKVELSKSVRDWRMVGNNMCDNKGTQHTLDVRAHVHAHTDTYTDTRTRTKHTHVHMHMHTHVGSPPQPLCNFSPWHFVQHCTALQPPSPIFRALACGWQQDLLSFCSCRGSMRRPMSVAAAHHTANPLLAVKKHDAEAPPFCEVLLAPTRPSELRLNSRQDAGPHKLGILQTVGQSTVGELSPTKKK